MTLDEAETAFGNVDVEAFNKAVEKARAQFACVSEEITPALAAELHRVEGLYAYTNLARQQAVNAFAAARAIEPDYQFPSNVVSDGNPILDHYTAKDPVCDKERIPPPKSGKLRVDGQRRGAVPTEFPAIIQVLDSKGEGSVTQYHWPEEPLPYKPGSVRTTAQNFTLIGGAAMAVAGVGTFLGTRADTVADDPANNISVSRQRRVGTAAGATLFVAGLSSVGVSFVLPSKEVAQ